MSKSSLVDYTLISPNKTIGRNHSIDTITIHCFVGQVTVERGCEVFKPTSKKASCNYLVAKDGKIGLVVDEKDRSWCTSNSANDNRAVTIEVASDTTGDLKVTDAAYNALIKLVADICKRNNIKKLVWSTDKNKRVNHLDGCNMTVHRDYANKSCPGEYLYSHHGDIAAKVNSILNSNVNAGTETTKYYRVRLSWADAKSQLGAYTDLENAKKACKTGYSVYDWNGNEVYSNKVSASGGLADGCTITLKAGATYLDGRAIPSWITKSTLYYRGRNSKGIMFSTQKTGAITGVVDESAINGLDNNSSTNNVANNKSSYKVKVTASALNYRKGPGVSYGINGTITDRGVYTITDESNGWGKLSSGAGWICLKYTKRV